MNKAADPIAASLTVRLEPLGCRATQVAGNVLDPAASPAMLVQLHMGDDMVRSLMPLINEPSARL